MRRQNKERSNGYFGEKHRDRLLDWIPDVVVFKLLHFVECFKPYITLHHSILSGELV